MLLLAAFFTFYQSKQTLPLVALHSILTIVPGASFVNQSEKLENLLLQTAEEKRDAKSRADFFSTTE